MTAKRLSLAFAGTPVFAAHILEQLIESGYSPGLVLTRPDQGAGRGRKRAPTPTKQTAQQASLPVSTPASAAGIQPALAKSGLRCADRRRLRPDIAARRASAAATRLCERPCLPAAPLARRRARRAGPDRRRSGNRGFHHADGRRARHRSRVQAVPARDRSPHDRHGIGERACATRRPRCCRRCCRSSRR